MRNIFLCQPRRLSSRLFQENILHICETKQSLLCQLYKMLLQHRRRGEYQYLHIKLSINHEIEFIPTFNVPDEPLATPK